MNTFPSKPKYIQFYPTLRCNLSCTFCFNRGIRVKKDIPIDDCARVIAFLADKGVKEIDILGGEPTLHPHFVQVVKLIYQKNLKAFISSNGCNVHLLEKISQTYEKDQIQIGVSLNDDSVPRELHEYIIKYKPFLKSVCSKKQTFPETHRKYLRCPAGTTKLTVMPDGTVYPCYLFARHDNFRLGNILVDDFVKIWKNSILDFFRNFEKN